MYRWSIVTRKINSKKIWLQKKERLQKKLERLQRRNQRKANDSFEKIASAEMPGRFFILRF
ncbi:MAG: hypothetical protein A2928_00320 [Candidatus Taylorbacteria bacterium RIFCSPLOWO2_01_FULL_45_15b]|uniref:Uncharacterized protein n=1 Tax=Candidatus Taylorbacteria bacterium RIFCSPLOWO2_01_FULL_45_15b TaxID=1802319 RepID=A0A1G2NHH9_9BACT|nr:MAG: hypothetical protein A2928_00320 [Candidatus Taylorbacteria bacterium RIFCSPLOWO2_01_FULL_45_15b]